MTKFFLVLPGFVLAMGCSAGGGDATTGTPGGSNGSTSDSAGTATGSTSSGSSADTGGGATADTGSTTTAGTTGDSASGTGDTGAASPTTTSGTSTTVTVAGGTSGESSTTVAQGSDASNSFDLDTSASTTDETPVLEDGACAIASAEATLIREPVDIILALDNSGSMDEELDAVEQNINVNFANILAESGVDYRVILISRHRDDDRSAGSVPSTSICVTSPLSGQATCPADQPVFGERFFHYSSKIESDDSFDVLLATYAPPFADQEDEDKYDQAPNGWSEWLRPGARKVFLELTDDNEDMTVDAFLTALTALGPEHFGTASAPTFIWHSICGVVEKATPTDPYLPDEPITAEKCDGNGGDVTTAGVTYQELSKLTGGLRLPICQWTAYDTVFETIAEDVVIQTEVACDFAIPDPPAGETLDLEKVAVKYAPGDGAAEVQFGQALTAAECQDGAFYIDGDRINLCPETCAVIKADPMANVDVLFTCESQIIILR